MNRNYRRNRRYKNQAYRGRRRYQWKMPLLSTQPTKLGVGTAKLFVTKLWNYDNSSANVATIGIQEIFQGSPEFAIMKNEYMYFKILKISAVILPRNMINTSSIGYIMLNWANDHDYTIEQIQFSDNSKMIPPILTKAKVIKYIPPNILVNTLTPTNPSEYHTTASINNYPGWFKVTSGTLSLTIRFEIKVVFRGLQDFSINQLIKDLKDIEMNRNKGNKGKKKRGKKENKIEEKINKKKEEVKENKGDIEELKEENKLEEKRDVKEIDWNEVTSSMDEM